jgi:hypothetical protein
MHVASFIWHGEGRSLNARQAEVDGKMPLLRASASVAKSLAITKAAARALVEAAGPCEWHHVGKYAARVDYYDTRAITAAVIASGQPTGISKWPADWKDQMDSHRDNHNEEAHISKVAARDAAYAASIKVPVSKLIGAYYGC